MWPVDGPSIPVLLQYGGPWSQFGSTTDLVIGNGVSNIIHEFGQNMDILVIFCVTRGLDATKYSLKSALDPIEGTEKE